MLRFYRHTRSSTSRCEISLSQDTLLYTLRHTLLHTEMKHCQYGRDISLHTDKVLQVCSTRPCHGPLQLHQQQQTVSALSLHHALCLSHTNTHHLAGSPTPIPSPPPPLHTPTTPTFLPTRYFSFPSYTCIAPHTQTHKNTHIFTRTLPFSSPFPRPCRTWRWEGGG